MVESEPYVSWSGGPASAADARAARRRERRRRWVRPPSLTAAPLVALADTVALVGAAAVESLARSGSGRPCATFWRGLDHDATIALWTTAIVLAAVLALSLWRPWIAVAALVVQLAAAAILLPSIVDGRSQFTAVAEGRLSPVQVDTHGAACDG